MKHLSVRERDPFLSVSRAARWAGIELDAVREDQLRAFARWLVEEAIPAGGIGPDEGPVVYSRHIADSLLFASVWERTTPPTMVLDLGSGVGLPGIPLAILWPTSQVILLDRSTRRGDLARRAIRLLELPNAEVVTRQIKDWSTRCEMIVCRGVTSPGALRKDLGRLLTPSGLAVVGGSHRSAPLVDNYQVTRVPETIIGNPVWLLSMGGT